MYWRIGDLLKSLIERQAAKSESADHRLLALRKELSDCEDRMVARAQCVADDAVFNRAVNGRNQCAL